MSFYAAFAESYEAIFPFDAAVYTWLRRYICIHCARQTLCGCTANVASGAWRTLAIMPVLLSTHKYFRQTSLFSAPQPEVCQWMERIKTDF